MCAILYTYYCVCVADDNFRGVSFYMGSKDGIQVYKFEQ